MTSQPKWMQECLTALSGMNAGRDAWEDRKHIPAYALVLRQLGERLSRDTVRRAVTREDWRPSPAKLLEIAARRIAPAPEPDTAWAEWWSAVERSDPRPQWSHPLVGEIGAALGSPSWKVWAELYPHLSERDQRGMYHAQFGKLWPDMVARWVSEACDYAGLPPAQWPERMQPTVLAGLAAIEAAHLQRIGAAR